MPKVILFAIFLLIPAFFAQAEVRVGIIGVENAKAIAFTQILNDPNNADHLPGARVVAAYTGGHVDKLSEELKAKWKVDIMPDVGALCRKVDAVMIGSEDSGARLEQIKMVIAAGKTLFIESPLAPALDDARSIAKLAKDAGVAWFSASGVRFGEAGANMQYSDALGASAWGPGPIEKRYDSIEALYSVMGTGCEEVTRVSTDTADVLVGRWKGGRIGVARSLRAESVYGAVVFRTREVAQSRSKAATDYRSLFVEIVKFFESRQPPVSSEEALEIAAFVDAAQRSKAAGGAPTKLR